VRPSHLNKTVWGGKNEYWLYAGYCPYMLADHAQVLAWIARVIYHRFPDRLDRRLWIGDCTPWTGNCPGHPDGTHSNNRSLDLNYYTFEDNHATHFTEDYSRNLLWIWDRTDHDRVGYAETLLPIFDAQRNFECWKLIAEAFPQCRIMTNTALYEAMRSCAGALPQQVSHTEGRLWNHHLHVHIDLGVAINWDVALKG